MATTNRFAQVVRFKRTRESEWEYGLAIGGPVNDVDLIVDADNKPVIGTIWDYRLRPESGCMHYTLEVDR